MNLVLRTWNTNDNDTVEYSKKGLRYNAGSWIAEIFDNQWTSYDIVKTIKVSETQWEEWLQPHEVPKLPRDSFGVEEFLYSQVSPSEFQLKGWSVQMSRRVSSEGTHPNQIRDQSSQQQPQQTEQLGQPAVLNRQPPRRGKGGKPQKQQNTSASSSSNQTSHVQPQQQGPRKRAKHSQPQTQVVSISLPIQQWTPLQIHSAQPLQHLTPIASSGSPRDSQVGSPRRPKNHPGKQSGKRPIVYGLLTAAQGPSVCRIQD